MPATRKSAKRASSGKGKIHLKWVRSAIASPEKHKRVVRGLGFTRLNQVIEREDSPSIRGMVDKVPHLVKVVNE
ncbi:MAG: 50S ribosomal protein L30 [Terriglobales bacterium]|nr:50S ribosomal protein L30 [Terriglobales bacterium]